MKPVIDETHDPKLVSWVVSAQGHSDFPVQNLPLGIFKPQGAAPRAGTAIGEMIFDLNAAAIAGLLPAATKHALQQTTLNEALALPVEQRVQLRKRLSELFTQEAHRDAVSPLLFKASDCEICLPATVGDYTDFFVGINHALNAGRLFRPNNPLLPNYKYVPIGYHGRASSIRPSGIPVLRPNGQVKKTDEDVPEFVPCRRLDYELELGVWVSKGNELGVPIAVSQASKHIAGFCLLNDWSARDIQAWEYVPLGPFLAKNFHSTISPWIITVEAMAPFFVAQPSRPAGDPAPLPYLLDEADQKSGALGLDLEVTLLTPAMRESGVAPFRLSKGSATNMYWTVAQMVAHHTSNGCNLNTADLLGTGTISTSERSGFGSLLEITRAGADPIELPHGETRTFLQDGDEVIFSATATAAGFVPIGFGPCRAVVKPAR